MPVVTDSAYVSMETVMNLIRAIANDMIYSQAGEILTDQANFTLPLLNDSLEWFTNEVGNHGVETFVKETVLTPLTATPAPQSVDPATQVNIGDQGYFDGFGLNVGPQLQIPPDLLQPQFMWERQTGSTENWVPMAETLDGLPAYVPASRFRMWEWRTDAIYMPGATQSNDLRLRYEGSLAMFVSTSDTLFFRGATGAIAYYTVSTYLSSKNPAAAQAAESRASQRVSQICTRSSRMKQRAASVRRSYGSERPLQRFFPPRNP
jgi:hypothetical protein